MTLPDAEDLQAAWIELQQIHKEHLAVHGVRLPKAEHYADSNKSLWLAVLYLYMDREVHKDEISQIAQRDIPDAGADQQVRHLKRDGWSIGDKPGVHKLNPYRPSAEFVNEGSRKRARLEANSFSEIKEAFGSRCATCGAREGFPDPRYGDEKVKLQQGHQDPHGAGDDKKNIIPQCQFCNRTYADDYVFDDKGRVRAVANVRPVQRASESVQRKVLDWLIKQFGVGKRRQAIRSKRN